MLAMLWHITPIRTPVAYKQTDIANSTRSHSKIIELKKKEIRNIKNKLYFIGIAIAQQNKDFIDNLSK